MSASNPIVEYRDVPGHPGYRVGNDGSVWSCWEQSKRPRPGHSNGFEVRMGSTWRLKKQGRDRDGYRHVDLQGTRRRVHHLVLEAFVGQKPKGMQACHFPDRDRSNNRLSNLRWGTGKDNSDDKRQHGNMACGERQGLAKLNAESVRQARLDYATGKFILKQLAERYGVAIGVIHNAIHRKTWKHVT